MMPYVFLSCVWKIAKGIGYLKKKAKSFGSSIKS